MNFFHKTIQITFFTLGGGGGGARVSEFFLFFFFLFFFLVSGVGGVADWTGVSKLGWGARVSHFFLYKKSKSKFFLGGGQEWGWWGEEARVSDFFLTKTPNLQ